VITTSVIARILADARTQRPNVRPAGSRDTHSPRTQADRRFLEPLSPDDSHTIVAALERLLLRAEPS